mmetsp:Transcript_13512/g.38951  ORF Transcript_13512/g.38951 Transcript_13512/m.38951 type:complete len:203 (-) Transcript_13512:72-680(-)
MSSADPGNMTIKNTFLEVACGSHVDSGTRTRGRSTPLRMSKSGQDADLYLSQLSRLDTTLAVGAPSGSFAPSPRGCSVRANNGVTGMVIEKHLLLTPKEVAMGRASSGTLSGDATQLDRPPAVRKRPCKGKRDRIRKALSLVRDMVARDPNLFVQGRFFLPTEIEQNAKLRARTMADLTRVAAEAFQDLSDRAAGRSASLNR